MAIGGHFGQHGLDRLQRADWLAELDALTGILCSVLHSSARDAERLGGFGHTGHSQRFRRNRLASVHSSQHLSLSEHYVVENHVGSWASVKSHVSLVRTNRESRRLCLYQEGGHALRAGGQILLLLAIRAPLIDGIACQRGMVDQDRSDRGAHLRQFLDCKDVAQMTSVSPSELGREREP